MINRPTSDPDKERRACTSKKKYGTKALAESIAASSNTKLGTALHVYCCQYCHAFHLTSSRSPWPARTRPKHRKTVIPKYAEGDPHAEDEE